MATNTTDELRHLHTQNSICRTDESVWRPSEIVQAMQDNYTSRIYYKRNNKKVDATYADIHEEVVKLSRAMRAMGVSAGDVVAIHGDTSIDWLLVDLACALLGCVSVAIYPNAPITRIKAVLTDCCCNLIFTSKKDFVSSFKNDGLVVVLMDADNDVRVPTVQTMKSDTVSIDRTTPRSTNLKIVDEVFTIVSTSGTLAEPKLFGVSLDPLMETMKHFIDIYTLSRQDRLLLFLPLSHLPQRMIVYGLLSIGVDIVLSDMRSFLRDFKAYEPTLTVTVPRVLEYLVGKMENDLSCSSPQEFDDLQTISKTDTYDDDPGRMPAVPLVHNVLGRNIRTVFVGSAPTPAKLMRKSLYIGIPLYEVYGTTELGMIAITRPERRRIGYAGEAIPWGRVKVSDSNELMLSTPTPFLYGFVKGGQIDPCRWPPEEFFSSGDVGYISDNYVKVVSRVHDFCALSSGEKIFVNTLEQQLTEYLPGCIVTIIGNGEKHLHGIFFIGDDSNIEEKHVIGAVESYNNHVHRWERLRYIAIWGEYPRIEDGCMTDTMKPRRHQIEQHYKSRSNWIQLF